MQKKKLDLWLLRFYLIALIKHTITGLIYGFCCKIKSDGENVSSIK